MSDKAVFETPENVTVQYEIAGPGTRFVAWVFDMLIILIAGFVLLISTVILGLMGSVMYAEDASALAVAVILAVVNFAFVGYFMAFEFFMHGQTPGKRSVSIRVVSNAGFGLSPGAILIRNIFRLLDTVPILWFVPVVTERGQRLGDMVAGTIVIQEQPPAPDAVAERVSRRNTLPRQYTFTPQHARTLSAEEVRALKLFMGRIPTLAPDKRTQFRARFVRLIEERTGLACGDGPSDALVFLEEFLAAHHAMEMRELQ